MADAGRAEAAAKRYHNGETQRPKSGGAQEKSGTVEVVAAEPTSAELLLATNNADRKQILTAFGTMQYLANMTDGKTLEQIDEQGQKAMLAMRWAMRIRLEQETGQSRVEMQNGVQALIARAAEYSKGTSLLGTRLMRSATLEEAAGKMREVAMVEVVSAIPNSEVAVANFTAFAQGMSEAREEPVRADLRTQSMRDQVAVNNKMALDDAKLRYLREGMDSFIDVVFGRERGIGVKTADQASVAVKKVVENLSTPVITGAAIGAIVGLLGAVTVSANEMLDASTTIQAVGGIMWGLAALGGAALGGTGGKYVEGLGKKPITDHR